MTSDPLPGGPDPRSTPIDARRGPSAEPALRSRALDRWAEPEAVFAELGRDGAAAVWRDPMAGTGPARSFVGLAPRAADVVVVDRDAAEGGAALGKALRERLASDAAGSDVLGWWGWLAYEFGSLLEGLPAAADDTPTSAFAFVDRGLVFDHVERTVELTVLARSDDAERWLDDTADRLQRLPATVPSPAPAEAPVWRWRHDRSAYLDRITACLESIRRGDAYQLCLTDEITTARSACPEPLDVYRRLRQLTPTTHAGVFRLHDRWLLSASPERLLSVSDDGEARTQPIKGTRGRSSDARQDQALASELLSSEKERAENLMIVDLMRNDLSRVSRVGSVRVSDLFHVESLDYAHQLVSTVEATLETDAVGALLALFPAGSMTGAPKHAAMRILTALEDGARGVYSGVWGRLSLDGSADLAVVIRSIVMGPDDVRIGVGGGITALSVPSEEWDEVRLKARPMLLAIGADPAAASR